MDEGLTISAIRIQIKIRELLLNPPIQPPLEVFVFVSIEPN